MDSPGAVADFVRWGLQQAPADHVLLLVLGHGRPSGEVDGGPGSLRASNLARGLAQATTSKLDVVFLDCCYGGSVETAGTLQGAARYLVGAPGLIYAPGLPWGRILADLSGRPEMSPRELSVLAVQEAQRSWSGRPDREAGLLAVDLAQAEGLSSAVEQLARVAGPGLDQGLPALTLARGQAANWGPQGEMVDAGALAEALAQVSTSPAVAEAAEKLGQAVRAATCAAWTRSDGRDLPGGGPALFFPLQPSVRAAQYDSSAPAGLTAVWGPFVRAYLQKLMRRADRGGTAGSSAV
jgi:hypothetical protein